MGLIRNLCWWLPQCQRCSNRPKVLHDELCMECYIADAKGRIWECFADAASKIVPPLLAGLVESIPVRRRFLSRRRRTGKNPHRATNEELRELRKMAGLPEKPHVERSNPNGSPDSDEAKP